MLPHFVGQGEVHHKCPDGNGVGGEGGFGVRRHDDDCGFLGGEGFGAAGGEKNQYQQNE